MKYNNIKALRLEKGISQKQIAIYLNCSQRAYSHYELGDRDIPSNLLIALSKYYEVSVDYILGLSENR